MAWLAGNWMALSALLISVVLAAIRVAEWRQSRHRVYVEGRSFTIGVPSGAERGTVNYSYAAITVTTEGRPIAVRSIEAELVDPLARSGQGPSMGSVSKGIPIDVGDPFPTIVGAPVNIAAGVSKMWKCSLDVPPYDYTSYQGYLFRVKVFTTNGRSYKSEPFWHVPTPEEGWSEGDYVRMGS